MKKDFPQTLRTYAVLKIYRKNTWREQRAVSMTGKPPKSNKDKFLSEERSETPSDVTPVCEILNSSKVGIDKRCFIPVSVILGHLERSSFLKLFIPGTRCNVTIKAK